MSGALIPEARTSIVPWYKGSKSDRLGFLCFTLGAEEFGVDLNLVRQIVKPPKVTWVPRVDSDILGIVSIRGQVVSLFDLRLIMGFDATAWNRASRILIVEHEGEAIGLLVDSVTHVRRVKISELEQDLGLSEGRASDHVLCVARPLAGRLIVIMDLETLVAERLK